MSSNPSTSALYVPIDIGKNVNSYGAFAGEAMAPIMPIVEVRNTLAGYSQFRTWLDTQLASGRYAPLVVGFEPTGIYHEAWMYALAQPTPGLTLRLINPYQTKQKRKELENGRPRKNDPIDVKAMAYCLRDGVGNPVWLRQGQALQFDLWASDYRQAQRAHQQLVAHLLTQMDRLWPGAVVDVKAFHSAHPKLPLPEPLVRSHPLERKLVRIILEQRPNPHDWQRQSVETIQIFFRAHGLRCGPVTATRVWGVVEQALLPPADLAHLLAARLQRDYARFTHSLQDLADLRQQGVDLVPHSAGAVLTTLPGVNALLAAEYLAYVGDVQRFANADQVWALAGLDVSQQDSGDHRHHGHITRRGDAGLRQVLFTIGLKTSQACDEIAQARQRALRRGKHPVGAVLHAAHKANRVCFALLKQQVPYDPRRVAG